MKTVSLAAVVLAAAVTLPAPAADTGATPAVGAPAPDFSLTSNEGKTVKLSDFKGKWVVLYFYPKDFTSGCTMEAHNFQRDLAKYDGLNAAIVGVSRAYVKIHHASDVVGGAVTGLVLAVLLRPVTKRFAGR